MEKLLSGIAIVISVIALFVTFAAFPARAPVGGTTNFDLLDTTDGFAVDGTTVIDGSGNVDAPITSSTGSFSGLLTLNAGQLRSYTNATTSDLTTQTLEQADILSYDTVLFTPTVGAITLTFPATSTLTSFVPTAGDMAEQCWYNATSTASQNITFVAGTGMDLERVATSTTAGVAGVLAVPPQGSACFTFIRQADTDITALMRSFLDAD